MHTHSVHHVVINYYRVNMAASVMLNSQSLPLSHLLSHHCLFHSNLNKQAHIWYAIALAKKAAQCSMQACNDENRLTASKRPSNCAMTRNNLD